MSLFGTRIAYANKLLDREFADPFDYFPMREVVNAQPEDDPDRAESQGRVAAILLQPGKVLGSGHGLNAMHERSTSEPQMWFMARGKLLDVRRFDRFILPAYGPRSPHNVDLTGTHVYEVGDGPRPYGFGRYTCTLVEIDNPIVNPLVGEPSVFGAEVDEEAIPF